MLDDSNLFQNLWIDTLPPEAPLAMPRQVLERPRRRRRRRWLRLALRFAR